MLKLLMHQWKEKLRAPFWQKNILLNVILALLGLFYFLSIAVISYSADLLILELESPQSIQETFTRFLFYYFLLDLIMRFSMQEIPTLTLQPYLTLPIKKRILLHFPLIKSTFHFFTISGLLLILPFFIKNIYPIESLNYSLAWVGTILSCMAINNYLNFFIKKYFLKNIAVPLFILTIVAAIFYVDIHQHFSFSAYFLKITHLISTTGYLVVGPLLLATLCYCMAYYFIKNNSFLEESKSELVKSTNELSFFKNYGELGQLISVEVKLILRNKRPRSLFIFSLLFVLYGFSVYEGQHFEHGLKHVIAGLLIPFIFSLNYGQYLFSWESSFFDTYLTNKISLFTYLKSKHLFLSILSLLGFIITLIYAVISYKIVLIHLAFLVYNLGISTFLLLFFCTFNASYIDLGKNQLMNYQGTGVSQFLMILPIVGFPLLIYFLHKAFDILPYFYYTIATLGLAGIALHKFLLSLIHNQFTNRKYKMSAGFRQN